MHFLLSWLQCRNMSGDGAPDSSIVENLKKFLMKYGTELLKPYDFTEELIKRLDNLEYLLSKTFQEHTKLVETFLQPSKEALITKALIRHHKLDIRVSVASCISQIIRILAPKESFGDDSMKEFFYIANSAFERLPFMHGRVYSKAVSILSTMSLSQSSVMMLDLGLYDTIDHMFHLFLNGIRTEHPHDIFISMEKIMMTIIRNNVDNDEFSLVLVKILLNNLRRENQNVAPVSFKLAGNTLKNCSSDLKAYLPEAVRCSDVPIEDYAEEVVSLFQDVTQKHIMDSKDAVENVSYPGKSELETDTVEKSKNEPYYENQGMTSHCFDDPDEAGKAMHGQQEQKPEELHIGRKRIRRPSSLKKAEEGYDPFWMLIDWRSMNSLYKKNKNINFPAKTKTSKDLSTKPAGKNISNSISPRPSKMKKEFKRNEEASANKALEPTSEEIIVVSEDEDQPRGIFVKRRSGKGQGSLMKGSHVKKIRRKAVVAEDLNEDIMNHSYKGKGSFTKVSLVKKSRRKTVISEDLKEEIMSCSEKGQGSLTKVSPVKKSMRKTVVSENLKEDIVQTLASKCRPVSSQDEARSVEVSKQNQKGSVPRPRKRTANEPVGEEMVGCRIKVWWPLDQTFYEGKIMAFDDFNKFHQVDYDDGDIEKLDLTTEWWELLQEQEIGADPSSSKAK
ncbi:hypothetical protein AAHA92_33144 [Salvia divinorum]|uniref:Uncharacterized protein n=1 Tax=Salvia divinorum TaxID=28513 RepID=A0ABD1FN19_SALDI